MIFRYYTNAVSQASRALAGGILSVGLLLMGFGVIIAAFPEVFAYLAAAVIFLVGVACALTAAKIFWAQKRAERSSNDPSNAYRENVRIHTTEFDDF